MIFPSKNVLIRSIEVCVGTASVERNLMTAKLKGNFFVLPRVAFDISITGHIIGVKISVCFVDTLSFRGGKEIQEVVRTRLDTWLRFSSIDGVVSRRCKLRKTGE